MHTQLRGLHQICWEVLSKYLSLARSNKNGTFVTTNTVKQFVNIISNWMREKTSQTIKSCDYLTVMLDESLDESNCAELSLIFRIVHNGIIENHFLDLMQLQRCDIETIFRSFETNLCDSGV